MNRSAHLASRLSFRLILALLATAGVAGCAGQPEIVQPTGYGGTCYAGAYVCQLQVQAPVGSQCTCPGLGAPSYGAVR